MESHYLRVCIEVGIPILNTSGVTYSGQLIRKIDEACGEPDPSCSNRLITQLHYSLSEALAGAIGREAGPNFHSWAVWGSQKAGATIRQEDLDASIKNATTTAAIVGGAVGVITGVLAQRLIRSIRVSSAAGLGAVIGAMVGGWTGKQLAIWSRREAANLVLAGNRTVIEDIGAQSARFIELLGSGATSYGRGSFFAGLRSGPSEQNGQDRLSTAFRSYLVALDSTDLNAKRAAMIAGNCEIVHHEHIRLEPYICRAMPFIVRRCATQRLMTYDIGGKVLRVGADLPGVPSPTAARNWANIDDRMRYIFALFQNFHDAPEVFSAPSSAPEMPQA